MTFILLEGLSGDRILQRPQNPLSDFDNFFFSVRSYWPISKIYILTTAPSYPSYTKRSM